VCCSDGTFARAAVPSGASTGRSYLGRMFHENQFINFALVKLLSYHFVILCAASILVYLERKFSNIHFHALRFSFIGILRIGVVALCQLLTSL
jgi:hypothetical protein